MSAAPRFVTRWDLDKTYLRSRFDTLSELVSSALERAEDKRAVPGATALLNELSAAGARVHILSGSPRQMRRTLEAKLELDGVRWDELTLKPNLQNLVKLRLGALRDQLGYKLPELLAARARDEQRFASPDDAREVLFGDDSESDAFVYSLYADLCRGAVDARELERIFDAGKTHPDALATSRSALDAITRANAVDCILIHLDGQTPPSSFSRYGARLVPFYNYLQAAFVLLERAALPGTAVLRVAAAFVERFGFMRDTIARSYFDLRRRGRIGAELPALLARASRDDAATPWSVELLHAIDDMQRDPAALDEPPPETTDLDYLALAEKHRHGQNRRRPGQRFV